MVVQLLRDLCARLGVTVVASTHDPTVAEEASRVVRMQDGQILDQAGSADPGRSASSPVAHLAPANPED